MAPSSPLVVKMVGMERRQLSWQRGGQRSTDGRLEYFWRFQEWILLFIITLQLVNALEKNG